jgi:hypothetical protein
MASAVVAILTSQGISLIDWLFLEHKPESTANLALMVNFDLRARVNVDVRDVVHDWMTRERLEPHFRQSL